MDAEQIGKLKPELAGFLAEFNDCFARCYVALLN